MRFRIRHADRIVGLFVLLAAAGLVAGIILLGVNQRWFAKNYAYTTRFNSGAGVPPGTAIFMKGFQVGKIQRLKLTDDNMVDADFVIFDTYYRKATQNSVLELVTSPIGLGTQLLFHPGKSAAQLPEGSFVPLADSEQGRALIEEELVDIPPKDDTITRLLASVNPLLENLGKTVVTVNRTLTELNRAIAGQTSSPLGRIVSGTANTVEHVDQLVVGMKGQTATLVDQAGALVESLTKVADNVEATTAAIRDPTGLVPKLLDAKGSIKTILDDKNALYDRILASVSEIQGALQNIQTVTASLSSEMPTIAVTIDETRTAIKQTQDVLEGLRNNPLLRGGIPERREQQSLYQSMREGGFE
ncbi:MAG TPA: MlaD family protein [Rectinemataceae bacterium]|nr:MlaD family protein [Rectinemataceae bacterium]